MEKVVLLCGSSFDQERFKNLEMYYLIVSCFLVLLLLTQSQANAVPRAKGRVLSVGSVLCWRKSCRRHDHQLTCELDLSRQRLCTPAWTLGIPVFPTVGNILKRLRYY